MEDDDEADEGDGEDDEKDDEDEDEGNDEDNEEDDEDGEEALYSAIWRSYSAFFPEEIRDLVGCLLLERHVLPTPRGLGHDRLPGQAADLPPHLGDEADEVAHGLLRAIGVALRRRQLRAGGQRGGLRHCGRDKTEGRRGPTAQGARRHTVLPAHRLQAEEVEEPARRPTNHLRRCDGGGARKARQAVDLRPKRDCGAVCERS